MLSREHASASLVRSLLSQGRSTAEVLQTLRTAGVSMGESSVALAEGMKLDLAEAQRMVVHSKVWKDHSEAQSQLEDAFWGALDDIAALKEDGSEEIKLSDLDRL